MVNGNQPDSNSGVRQVRSLEGLRYSIHLNGVRLMPESKPSTKPEAPKVDTTDETPTTEPTETPAKTSDEALEARRTEAIAALAADGVLVDPSQANTDTTHAVKPADESAPDGASTDRADGVSIVLDGGGLADAPATMADQKAPRQKGKAYQQGYVGVLPDADNRPDLTLAGVLGLNDTED